MAVSKNKYLFLVLLASLASGKVHAQEPTNADLEEVNVFESLNPSGDSAPAPSTDVQMSTLEEQDDLQSLKEDVGEIVFDKEPAKNPTVMEVKAPVEPADQKGPLNVVSPKGQNVSSAADDKAEIIADEGVNFDVGSEEKKLLELSKYVQHKITPKEWDDRASQANVEKSAVQKGAYRGQRSLAVCGAGL